MKIIYWIILILVYVFIDTTHAIGGAQFSNKTIQKQYDTLYKKIDSIPETQTGKNVIKMEQLFGQYEDYLIRMDNALQRKDTKTYKTLSFSSRKILLALNREIRLLSNKISIVKTQQNSIPVNNTDSDFLQKEITYYADIFEGRNTANGDIFNQENFSAAVCDIPLGSLIQVRANNKSILVEANDRPNCNKYPNVVDLSTRAFASLASLSTGRIKGAQAKLITTNLPSGYKKRYLKTDTFSKLGILLDSNIPNTYLLSDRVRFSGKVINTQKSMVLYVFFPSGKKESFNYPVDSNGKFIVDFLPKEEGIHSFILASGDFTTSLIEEFYVINNNTIKGISYNNESTSNLGFSSLGVEHRNSYERKKNIQLSLPSGYFYLTTLEQGVNKIIRSGVGGVTFSSDDLKGFTPGLASIKIESFRLSTSFTHDIHTTEGVVYNNPAIQIVSGYSSEGAEKASITVNGKTGIYSFSIPTNVLVQCSFFVTEPTGDVKKYSFPNSYCNDSGFLITGNQITGNFPMEYEGVYLFEMVDNYGKAYVNKSLHRGAVLPLLLSNRDKVSTDIRSNITQVRSDSIIALNNFRKSLGRNSLEVDSTLTNLAQKKAEDMIKLNYFGHQDPFGLFIGDSAKRFNIDTTHVRSIGENIAAGTAGDLYLYEELLLSGTHRFNILRSDWKKIGIGLAIANGKAYYVQLFSD